MKATSVPFSAPSWTNAALVASLSAALATAACANAAQGDETTAPAPTEETTSDTYLDAPQTPGVWAYDKEPGESFALFGEAGMRERFLLRCGDGAVSLAVMTGETQEQSRSMRVTTETVTAALEAAPVPSQARIIAADLDPNDPLLDAMAITKGRFAVEVEGFEPFYLPAWTEVSRVIEDCR